MADLLKQNRVILISSPAGSGKSSLLTLFAAQENAQKNTRCVRISCHPQIGTAFEMLKRNGIDLVQKICTFSPTEDHIVMFDDAQSRYNEQDFWTTLFKSAIADWLPVNIKFIISATYMLAGGVESPVEFQSLSKLSRNDLLLNHDEYKAIMQSSLGLQHIGSPLLIEVIWKSCGGLIGAIRLSTKALKQGLAKDSFPTENSTLCYYLSDEVTQQMARNYGTQHSSPVGKELEKFLKKCFFGRPQSGPEKLTEGDESCFLSLNKAGLVIESSTGVYEFSSPMAKRFYSRWLFPTRCSPHKEPDSLSSLIKNALSQLPSSLLSNAARKNSVPKEAVIQHLFMTALAKCTPPSCSIYGELSEILPGDLCPESGKVEGEIDFYLDGVYRWGIELMINGDGIGEHIARFSPDGKYHPLVAKDYAVVDFRRGQPVKLRNLHPNRITVFFIQDDFSECYCIFGKDRKPHLLSLEK